MSTTEQPEAIKLAKWLETIDDESWNSCWHSHTPQKAAAELRRLHAENAEVRAGYDAARLEIVSLQAQLEAVGAGGVGPLVGDTPRPNKATAQFLYDVMTAAGLVAHGKQCKALAERLSDGCRTLLTALAVASPMQTVAWPKNAKDVRDFMHANCQAEEYANDDHSPSENDRYQLTAHDFLSAVHWWAEYSSPDDLPEPVAQAQEDAPDMFWDADDTENFAHEIQDVIDGYGPGEIVTIECARRMPNIQVLVTQDSDGLSFEHLDAAVEAQKDQPHAS